VDPVPDPLLLRKSLDGKEFKIVKKVNIKENNIFK
jgi:hypothetical protein